MEEKKQNYASPYLEVMVIRQEDVVTTSPTGGRVIDPWEDWDGCIG